MELQSKEIGTTIVVNALGRVDATTAADFEKGIDTKLNDDTIMLIINLAGLDYMSSAGLRVILSSAKKMKTRQGDVLIVGLQGTVKEVFEMSGFSTLFKTFATEEEALAHI